MIAQLLSVLLGSAFLLQTPPDPPPFPDEDRPPPRRERPDRRRERMREYAAATPEQRREMRIDRLLRMVDRNYHLTDEQRPRVRDEIRAMQQEYYDSLGPETAAEYQELQDRMAEFWARQPRRPRGPDGPRPGDDPEFRKLRERLDEIRAAHPFDFDQSIGRIEALLPPEQVAEGRERRERMQSGFDRRGDGVRRGPPREGRLGPDDERPGDGRRRPRRGPFGGRPDPGPDGDWPPPRFDAPRPPPPDEAGRPRAPQPPGPLRAASPSHPWEVYARQFDDRHDLDPAQRAAVHGIVRELIEREHAYRAANREAFEDARQIESPEERRARLDELQRPVDELFEELRARLDDLLTASQRGMP